MTTRNQIVFIIVSILWSSLSYGDDASWDSAYWLNLGHYHPDSTISGYRSQADDEKFFFAKDGAINPKNEYLATRDAFLKAEDEYEVDQHPQCVFPARFHWMKSHDDALSNVQTISCPKLEEWVHDMQAVGVTMVFPAAYINSPSSMFGHTFIRIDSRKDRKIGTSSNPLLSRSFSYAAEMPADVNSWDFVWKGLFGGYPGLMTDAAYYDKVIDYNDIESRDIWEYKLDVTEEEMQQIIRHTWELQQVVFHYYFFDENCSYRLLSLLDVARPSLETTKQFSTHAIPSDTVRVIGDTGIIQEKVYRPSIQTILNYRKRFLSSAQRQWVLDIVNGTVVPKDITTSALTPEAQAEALDFTYEYQRYLARRVPQDQKAQAKLSRQILSVRSQLPEIALPDVPPPTSPEDGHGSGRWDIAYGEQEDSRFTSIRLRPAFHDLLDDDRGYVQGAKIDFLSFDVRYFDELEKLRLETLSVLDIAALNGRNTFFKPISWQIQVGWQEFPELEGKTNRFSLNGGFGLTWELSERTQLSLLPRVDIRAASHVVEDVDAGLGAEATLLVGLPYHAKFLAAFKELDYEGTNNSDGQRLRLGFNVPLGQPNNALRAEYHMDDLRYQEIEEWRFAFQRYF